jgi:hypothetical protein
MKTEALQWTGSITRGIDSKESGGDLLIAGSSRGLVLQGRPPWRLGNQSVSRRECCSTLVPGMLEPGAIADAGRRAETVGG